jgi:hypothetical protein
VSIWVNIHAFLPFLAFTAVVFVGTSQSGPEPEPGAEVQALGLTQTLANYFHIEDQIVRTFGPFLPYIVLGVRLLFLNYNYLAAKKAIAQECDSRCCTKSWLWATLIMLIFITVTRLLVYFGVYKYGSNYYYSDHIFLLSSLFAQLQTEFAVLQVSLHRPSIGCRVLLPFLIGWILVVVLLFEAFITARFYHTKFACWTAWSGGLVYQLIVAWWIRRLLHRPKNGYHHAALLV